MVDYSKLLLCLESSLKDNIIWRDIQAGTAKSLYVITW